MKVSYSMKTSLLLSLILCLVSAPQAQASVNLSIDSEEDNPFEDLFCTFIACTNTGEPEAFGFLEQLANDLSDFTLTLGGDNRRKLRRAVT